MSLQSYKVEGMTCASCVARVEKAAQKIEGLENIAVNLATEKISFHSDGSPQKVEELADKLDRYGYKLIQEEKTVSHESDQSEEDDSNLRTDFLIALIFTIPVFIISMAWDFEAFRNIWPLDKIDTNKVLLILTTPIIFLPAKRFFVIFWKNLKMFTAEMNSLIAVGTGSAYLFSVVNTLFPQLLSEDVNNPAVYFETAGVIVTLILLGRLFEERAKGKTGRAIKNLLELKPKTTRILQNGIEEEIPIEDLKIGDTVLVRPGDKLPADGIITRGNSTLDESMITGESIPVEKSLDSKVYEGTINKFGTFQFVVHQIGDNSVLGQIIKIVEEAQGSKAPVQLFADKVASIFTPGVIIIAIVTGLGWFISGAELPVALNNFVAVLIIACPCALGLATPTAIMVGTGLGASNSILIKNGESLEQLSKVDTVIFDKTGTITEGKPNVVEVRTIGMERNLFLQIVGSLENNSEHPLAKSIVNYCKKNNIDFLETIDFRAEAGKGIEGKIDEYNVIVGNTLLLAENGIEVPNEAVKLEEEHKLLLVGINNNFAGYFIISDEVKLSSKLAISTLEKLNIKTYLISGDSETITKRVAEETGFTNYLAEVLPTQKSEKVLNLQNEGRIVAMVGDGINDSPALATANVGIAIGSGTDVAINSAQIILIKNDPMDVTKAIKLSKITVTAIKQNLFWAFIYNTLGIPLAAFGLLNPMFAALAMAFSSVSVVSNSLRIRMKKL